MQCSSDNDRQIFQLIKRRMDEFGVTVINIAEENISLAQLIKKGIDGYPVTIQTDEIYRVTQLLGLISHHRYASDQIPSREELITLLEFGESHPHQKKPVDWGCE